MGKKKFKGFWVVALVVLLFALMAGASGKSDTTKDDSSEDKSTSVETETTVALDDEPDEVETEILLGGASDDADNNHSHDDDAEYITPEEFVTLTETILADSFPDGNFEVYYEEETGIIINVWDESVTLGVLQIVNGETSLIESWDVVRESMIEMSTACTESFQASTGRVDEVALVNVLNTENKENSLLSCANGTVLYDVVDEYR